MHQLNRSLSHKHNHHIKRYTRIYAILIFMVMRDYNIFDYNQHQLMKRAPTLVTGPSLVFLDPTKKSLRSPILKCKIPLASLMPIFYCHQSAAQPSLLIILCLSTLSSLLVNLFYSSILLLITQSAHWCCWSFAKYCWSSIVIKVCSCKRHFC